MKAFQEKACITVFLVDKTEVLSVKAMKVKDFYTVYHDHLLISFYIFEINNMYYF